MSHSAGSSSDKLRIIDENTYKQLCQKVQTSIKKYKRFREIPNLSQFINLRSQHKKPKRKPTGYAIYKVERKSVKKSKAKKRSKLKKCILKYRLLKRKQIEASSSNECHLRSGITEKLNNLKLQEFPNKNKAVHSRRFREYCDNTTSQELSSLVETLLRKLNHFQKRAFKINNYKGKSRRRIVIGFREVQVQMKIDKIKCVIIATETIKTQNKNFTKYCDNTTSQELSSLVETLLRKLNHFQKRAFKINNYKGKSRRRIVIGFREVQVQMKIDKIKCVIIATDCEKCDFEDGLDSIILEIKQNCKNSGIPCVFALQRRKLSYVLHQKCPTSCVGVIDYDGAQDSFFQLVERLEVEKSNYSHLFE